ncbi:MAG: fluoride efflux transporter CrcB [Succinatimonas hippei]|nr:fluoride efflux transporter CrcB [Succinatimonas hippei]
MTQLMINLLCVGAGGFIGAMIRAATGLWISKLTLFTGFPYATLFVNLIGCFLIGLFLNLPQLSSPNLRAFLTAGLLGGLTTFSTFTADNLNMLMHRDLFRALINMGVSLGLGLICCAAGVMLSRALVSKI